MSHGRGVGRQFLVSRSGTGCGSSTCPRVFRDVAGGHSLGRVVAQRRNWNVADSVFFAVRQKPEWPCSRDGPILANIRPHFSIHVRKPAFSLTGFEVIQSIRPLALRQHHFIGTVMPFTLRGLCRGQAVMQTERRARPYPPFIDGGGGEAAAPIILIAIIAFRSHRASRQA